MLVLEHGKPMIFGKDRDKGIRLNGLHPEVVTIGENGDHRGRPAGPRRAGRGPVPRASCCRGCAGRTSRCRSASCGRSPGRPTTQLIDGPDRRRGRAQRRRRPASSCSTAARPGRSSSRRSASGRRCSARSAGSRTSTGADDLRQLRRGPRRATTCPQPAPVVPGPAARRAPRRARRAATADRRAGYPGRRGRSPGCRRPRSDCVLVTVDDRLVGIFTDRDAVAEGGRQAARGIPRRATS